MVTQVKREKLLEVLRENRSKHRAIFDEAIENYKAECLSLLEKKIAKLKKGKMPRMSIRLLIPEDHTEDYDRVIKMFEMDVREEIELEENEFGMYVMDDWRWKREWLSNTVAYTSSA